MLLFHYRTINVLQKFLDGDLSYYGNVCTLHYMKKSLYLYIFIVLRNMRVFGYTNSTEINEKSTHIPKQCLPLTDFVYKRSAFPQGMLKATKLLNYWVNINS